MLANIFQIGLKPPTKLVSYYWYVLSKLQNKICHAYLVHGVISSKANMFEDAPRERN